MKQSQCVIKVFVLAGLVCALSQPVSSSPLFESEDILNVVLEAPLNQLSRQRDEEPELGGTFHYTDSSGADHALSVIVSTRGRSRLEVCDYPPLRFTFDRDETAGTLFEGQHKLKLVRQCMRERNSRNWVLLELGAYRAYNAISDYSFLTRQLYVTFRDTGSRHQRDQVQPAFLLEDDKDLAQRVNRRVIHPPEVEPEQMAVVETTHNLLFQYLIGNTDFAVKRGPAGEACCHNGRVLAEPGRRQDWIIVPYDFDFAGIINTEYALPGKGLPIRNVTTRLYRGFCWQNGELTNTIDLFNRKRSEIEAALLPQGISKSKRRRVEKYLEQFYEIVNNPEELQEDLLDKCRGPDSLPVYESTVSPRLVKTP